VARAEQGRTHGGGGRSTEAAGSVLAKAARWWLIELRLELQCLTVKLRRRRWEAESGWGKPAV
jgi:hypothetical protein